MSELSWIIDATTGDLIVEGLTAEEVPALAGDLLPPPLEFGCARPLKIIRPSPATAEEMAASICVRISGYYHNSLIEGPGRRSTAKLQGCVTHCRGCFAQDTWNPSAGVAVPVDRLAGVLLDPQYERDGVSLLGGEPFYQPEGLSALIAALRACGCPHILVYSGHPYERLQRMAQREPAIGAVLEDIDVLIDGPFVAALADRAGPWTGSGNQRVIELVATRQTGQTVLLDVSL